MKDEIYRKVYIKSKEQHEVELNDNDTSLLFSIEKQLPYPEPASKHQTDVNTGWKRCAKFIRARIKTVQMQNSKGKRIQGEGGIDYYRDVDGSVSYA